MLRLKSLAIFMLAAVAAGAPASAAFQEAIVSPEAAALGHTSLTASRDSASTFSNPALIAGMKAPDFYFMHNQMYAGMSGVGSIGQSFISGATPTRYGSFGFGVGMFRAAGLYDERTVALTYARSFGSRLQIGVTGKQLYHSYLIDGDALAAADPVFQNGHAKSAFGIDFGAILKVSDPLRLGVAVRNLNEPNVGLVVEDRVPREIQAGAAYDFAPKHHVRLTADVTYRDNKVDPTADQITPAMGLEKGFSDDRFVFRFGVSPLELTAGFGLRWGMIGLDYALVLRRTLLDGNVGTHMLGLRVRFGGGAK